MNKLVKSWNIIHYSIFKFERNTSYFINLPIRWLFGLFFEISFIKKGLKKRDSSKGEIFDVSEKVVNDSISGINIIISGIQMGGILVFIEYSIFNFVQGYIGMSLIQHVWENDNYKILAILALLVLPGIFNYLVLFRRNKYLKYFKEFEDWDKQENKKYGWLSFGFIIGVILLLISSFYFLTIRI